MKDILAKELQKVAAREERFNRAREFLQHFILKIMDDLQAFESVAFIGGTALRILYGLNRFSEDLDFSLRENAGKFDFGNLTSEVVKKLEGVGYVVDAKPKVKMGVVSAFLRFREIMREFDISPRKGEKLSIKVEVDTRPPVGAVVEMSPVNIDFFFKVAHYDLPSLFAGKLHAILYRGYTKGRDLYDFMWYVTKKVPVNAKLLHNAAKQTTDLDITFDREKIITMLTEVIEKMDISSIIRELQPLLVYSEEIRLIEKELMLKAAKDIRVVE
jgi:predicted nucleotidyltransferase component of viral defense system